MKLILSTPTIIQVTNNLKIVYMSAEDERTFHYETNFEFARRILAVPYRICFTHREKKSYCNWSAS